MNEMLKIPELLAKNCDLRNDTEIDGEESYSLCWLGYGTEYPWQRVQIFTGPKSWAIKEAIERLKEPLNLCWKNQ